MSKEFLLTAVSRGFGAGSAAKLGAIWNLQPVPATQTADNTAVVQNTPATALHLRGALNGNLYIVPDEVAASFVPPLAAPDDSAVSSSGWLALMQSFGPDLTQSLSERFGDMHIDSCAEEQTPDSLTLVGILQVNAGQSLPGTITLLADPALSVALESSEGKAHSSAPVTLNQAAAGDGSFERVIDVPLAVTLRFGKRQLTVRELLELNMGSLVELDRQVEEPVDLMLGDRLIARGEVVIVDGNYGMRVTEVIEQPSRRVSAAI